MTDMRLSEALLFAPGLLSFEVIQTFKDKRKKNSSWKTDHEGLVPLRSGSSERVRLPQMPNTMRG